MLQPDISVNSMISRRGLLGVMGGSGAALLLPTSGWAQQQAAPYPLIRQFVQGFVRRSELPGALVSIGKKFADPDIVAAGTIAFASKHTLDADSLFRIYSMTKPITGIAVMMLVDEGKLRLDQPLSDILPKFAKMNVQLKPDGPLASRPAKTPITIRHLLTHTSGLGYSIIQEGPLKTAYLKAGLVPAQFSRIPNPFEPRFTPAPDLEVFADRLAAMPLVYEPGTRFSYSVGLDVLGRVIEVISGQRFDKFLKTRLFDPLDMLSTSFIVAQKDVPRLTTNYGILNGFALPIDPGPSSIFTDNPGIFAGGAGLVSSARDYDHFLMMLLGEGLYKGERLLSAETAGLAMSNLLPKEANIRGTWIQGYGFGAGGRVSLPPSPEGEGVFGWNGAAGTIGWVDRKRQMRVTGMVQQMPMDSYPFQDLLPELIRREFGK